jgi:hypothetical protein
MRHYAGVIADSSRWNRFETRRDDVVISSPSKSGTTWTQHIIVRLVLGRVELDRPVSEISPWLDARTHTDAELFSLLDGQDHRRVLKTHVPLDGLPTFPDIRIVALARHPLDVALSFRDHLLNLDNEVLGARIDASSGLPDGPPPDPPPEDEAGFLSWWIDNDEPPNGAGPFGLADYCNSIAATWELRAAENVLLVHYEDLTNDVVSQIGRLATHLDIETTPAFLDEIARVTSLEALRGAAESAVPFSELGAWLDPSEFFRVGGRRSWDDLLDLPSRRRFEAGMASLEPAARQWALSGWGDRPAGRP